MLTYSTNVYIKNVSVFDKYASFWLNTYFYYLFIA